MPTLSEEALNALKLLVEAERNVKARFHVDHENHAIQITGVTAHDGSYHEFIDPIFVAHLKEEHRASDTPQGAGQRADRGGSEAGCYD